MNEKVKIALDAYKQGSNCAQAVVTAFADDLGLEAEELRRLMEGFGGGIAGMQEVCGAFTGATAVIGFLNSDGSIDAKTKSDTYKHIQNASDKFKEKHGSIICYDLLHGHRPVHLKCSDIIVDAVNIVEDYQKSLKQSE